MWWLGLAVMLCACSFERGGGAAGDIDAAVIDARPIDAAAPAACLTTYASPFGGHHYRLTDRDYTWQQARDFCASEGGHLVKVETREEDAFLADAIDGNDHPFVWLGLHDPGQNNQLVWDDGTPLGAFTHWELGQPSPATGNDCVDKRTTDTRDEWFAFDCADPPKRGVCECDG